MGLIPPGQKNCILILRYGDRWVVSTSLRDLAREKKIKRREKMAEKKKDILESLESQLRKKNADISVFKDLIDDYMSLYGIKKQLDKMKKAKRIKHVGPTKGGHWEIITE